MRDEAAAALASVAMAVLTSAAAHGAGNFEYTRGAEDAIRAAAIALRVWPQVQEAVETGKVVRLLGF